MALFHCDDEDVRDVKIVCSTSIRCGYKKTSAFFVHPIFDGKKEWPKTTDIPCYHDHHQFTTTPYTLPLEYDPHTNTYTTFGVFCSPSCVKGYMISNPVPSNGIVRMYLKKMLVEVFGIEDEITETGPFYLLKKYGGTLTVDQLRAAGRKHMRIIEHRLPFMACALAFELVNEHGNKSKTIEEEIKDVKKHKRIYSKRKQKNVRTDRSVPQQSVLSQQEDDSFEPSGSPSDDLLFDNNQGAPLSPPPVKFSESTASGCSNGQNEQENDEKDFSLPEDMVVVGADVANGWETRGLRRPRIPIKTKRPQKFQHGSSMYTDFLKERQSRPPPTQTKKKSKTQKRPPRSVHPTSTQKRGHNTLEEFLR